MKHERDDLLIEKAKSALLRCLQQAPSLSVELARYTPAEVDFGVSVRSSTLERVIVADVKQNGEPRFARLAVDRLYRCISHAPNTYGVFIAPYISPCAAQICVDAAVGYMDLAGNCRLEFDQVYIRVEGNSNPNIVKRDLRSLYSPRAERVIRVLLANPARSWRLQELSKEAGVSLGQAFNVKNLLENREWVIVENTGIRLSGSSELLAEWAENYGYQRSKVHEFYSMKGVADLEHDLAIASQQRGIDYALNGFSGSARYAATVRYQRVTAYVSERINELAQRMGLKEVSSGGNIALLEPYDEGVFYGTRWIGEDRVVTPVQCYLDVRSMASRGQEAADALLDRVIEPAL